MSSAAGRRPKPTHLRVVEGNAGKRPLPKNEPKVQRGVPKCPKHLSGVARSLWPKVGKDLDSMGVLTIPDALALELLVVAYAEFRDAHEVVEKRGFTYISETEAGGTIIRPNPEVAIRSDAWKRVLRILTEFGLTPSARSKVKALGDEIGQDPASTYLS